MTQRRLSVTANHTPPALSGKVVVITGATSGIGEATAYELAGLGARVVVIGRDRARGEAAIRRIQAGSTASAVDLVVADLASQKQVRQAVIELRSRLDRLDVLINNAGVDVGRRSVTEDGLELTFAVNYLAPFLLTTQLLELLRSSQPSRIVNVVSGAHRAGDIDFDDLQSEKRFGQRAYNNSKLALVMFTYELARRLSGTGVTANCVDPGFVRTKLGADLPIGYKLVGGLLWPFMANPRRGARSSIWAASCPELAEVSGAYIKGRRQAKSADRAYDEAVAERLWRVSEDLVAHTGGN